MNETHDTGHKGPSYPLESASHVGRSPRQTQSYLRQLFEARGLKLKNKLGQSFLIDLNLVELIVRTAELGPEDLAIEVGTGTGSLTAELCQRAGVVLGVEIDADFYALTRENTAAYANARLIRADILKNKNHLNPEVLTAIDEMLHPSPPAPLPRGERGELKRLKLVANLPYVVATPVITNFLLTDLSFERMVVTIQWELGERLAAGPSCKDFSALSVIVQSLAEVEIVRRMPPTAFWPKPKVDSAIVLIRPSLAKRAKIADLKAFHAFVRDLYLHRRKYLRGALLPMLKPEFDKPTLDAILVGGGFDPTGRAEALSVEEHLRLFNVLTAAKGNAW